MSEPQVAAPGNSLRGGVVWTLTGNAVYLGCQYGMLMAIAKLGDQLMVGQFSLALAIAAPIMIFSQMQLRQVLVTDVRHETALADYFSMRFMSTAAAMLLIAVVAFQLRVEASVAALILIVGAAKSFESLSDILHARLQRDHLLRVMAASMMLKGVSSLVLLAIVLALTDNLVYATVAMATIWGLMLVAFDLPVAARGTRLRDLVAWRPQAARTLVRIAWPLAFTSGLLSVSANVPRYFLQRFSGAEAVGLYSVAVAPLAFLTLFTTALGQATLARAAVLFQARRRQEFRRLVLQLTLLNVTIGVGFVGLFAVAGRTILTILFTEEFAVAAPLVVVTGAGVALGTFATFAVAVLSAARAFRLQLLNVIVVLVVQLPLCYLWVRAAGVYGAAWSEFARYAAATVFLIGAAVWVQRQAFAPRTALAAMTSP